ncbi:ABC transporter permease [Serratia liquefaciens]|uniref:ABC transporter permease n=1 Tax=Serratia liquefaciens TaxID=614 RepID=UPI003EC5FD56
MIKSIGELVQNRRLLFSLIKREIALKYKGSFFGSTWALLLPIFMLIIYTFVFSSVFKAKWGVHADNAPKGEFALILFIGVIAYNFFSECITRSPSIITGNPNYVKKVVFPLNILPCVYVFSALFNAFLTISVWLVCYLFIIGMPHFSFLLFPIILLPLVIFSLGVSYLFSSAGAYFRDINQVTGLLATALMFLSPIFYPVSAVPEKFRVFMNINPLTPAVEMLREIMYWGKYPDWHLFGWNLATSVVFFMLSFIFFLRTKKGFADVL